MATSTNTAIEALKIITSFFSDNSIIILLIVLLIICRKAVSNFIDRLTSLNFKGVGSELGLEAVAPEDTVSQEKGLHSAIEKPTSEDDEDSDIEDKAKEQDWFAEMRKAFNEGRLDDAEMVFKKYAIDEKDEIKIEKNKAIYFYFRFAKGKDNSAIASLEELAWSSKNEESKFSTLSWLSFCLRDSMQNKKEIKIWEKAAKETSSEKLVTRAIINLSSALNKENEPSKARKLLIERLSTLGDDEQKTGLYQALSRVELSLGNNVISVYCKDKSLEYDPNDREELFNTAYSASDEGVDEISISNYIKLIRIDSDHSTALNNLGVRAQKAELKYKAVENYKKSSNLKNTLAMANQGYLLLDAGFTEEAERIAKSALEIEDPHENIYSLLSAINEKKNEQDSKWKRLSEKSLERQKMIRSYTEQFYLGNANDLEGDWQVSEAITINIKLSKESLNATWLETSAALGGQSSYTIGLKGKVSGSTFSGTYTRKENSDSPPVGFLGLANDKNVSCIGYISDGGNKMNVISSTSNEVFSLSLSRIKA